jgi:hypothetical protein
MQQVLIIVTVVILFPVACLSQNLNSATAAGLEVRGLLTDGTQAIAQSNDLILTFEPGVVIKAVLNTASLYSEDESINEMINRITLEEISFETKIAPEQFNFQSNENTEVSAVAALNINGKETDFTITFLISNQKTNDANSFIIQGRGSIPVSVFGLAPEDGFTGDFMFMFSQNVMVTN